MCSVPIATAVRRGAQDAAPADSCQAQYFRSILEAERAKLDEKIIRDVRKLAALSNVEDAVGTKARRRRIRVMQRQHEELDRLIQALDSRLAGWYDTACGGDESGWWAVISRPARS
ncbi:MAG TPA: hypothetical protein VMU34_09025 [Mycobacterium sp.]|nr:hypothetical protein [Mycobacterium sp.]